MLKNPQVSFRNTKVDDSNDYDWLIMLFKICQATAFSLLICGSLIASQIKFYVYFHFVLLSAAEKIKHNWLNREISFYST